MADAASARQIKAHEYATARRHDGDVPYSRLRLTRVPESAATVGRIVGNQLQRAARDQTGERLTAGDVRALSPGRRRR